MDLTAVRDGIYSDNPAVIFQTTHVNNIEPTNTKTMSWATNKFNKGMFKDVLLLSGRAQEKVS